MAVYTEVADDDLARFVADYDIGAVLSCKGIAEGVENTNFILRAEKGAFILTLYEKRVRRDDLPFFLGLMEHLSARGDHLPDAGAGAATARSLGELAGRPAAMVTFLEGVWIRRPSVEHCAALGRGARRDASGGAGLSGPAAERARASPAGGPSSSRRAARRQRQAGPRRHGPGTSSRWPRRIGRKTCRSARSMPTSSPTTSSSCKGRLSGLIDFYFACTDILAYDVAICLNAWCFEPDHAFNVTKGRALLVRLPRGAAACRRRRSRPCPCWRAARRCASC